MSSRIIERRIAVGFVLLIAGVVALSCPWPTTVHAQAGTPPPAPLVDGQKVEVREGDAWSAATIVKHEGRRYFIHYEGADASADEWVTTDRIRMPGASPATKPGAAPATGAAPARGAAPKATVWNTGQKVEVKWGGLWRQASILNRRGEWYLVSYDQRGTSREWAEPWRIRAVGSTEDNIGYAKPNMLSKPTDPPPTPQPGPPTEPIGARRGSRGGAGVTNDPVDSTPAEMPAELKPIPADRASARTEAFSGAVGTAHIAPDAEARPAKELTTRGIGLASASPDVHGVFFSSPQSAIAAVCFGVPRSSKTTQVQRIDLVTGKSLGTSKFQTSIEGYALSPDGKLLLARNSFSRNQLDVWDISDSGGSAKHIVSFVPHETGPGDIRWMRFLDNEHLLTQDTQGTIAMWEFRTAKLVWSGGAHPNVTPTISPSGRYIAIGEGNSEIVIADARDGRPLGKLAADPAPQWVLSFKPDGKQLAGIGGESFCAWDLSNGKLAAQVTVLGMGGKSIDWVDEGFALVDYSRLVSLEKKLMVWTYEQAATGVGSSRAGAFAGRYWYTTAASQAAAALVPIELPDPAAREAAAAVDVEHEFAIHPGMKVSLDVRLSGDARQKVYDSLKKRLADNGLTIADGQPMKVVAYTENGEEHQMEYRSFGFNRGGPGLTKMNVRDIKNILAIQTQDGKSIWERQSVVTAPFGMTLKQGQTIEQAVAEHMVPNAGFFQSLNIPAYLPRSKNGLGTSKLTITGAQATAGG
ncbi:MAG TPA: Tudor-knot domain-containing protein [Humisphaera sp.]|nr:Tudor-knot domain-containing protein [Humisphaera sp.]